MAAGSGSTPNIYPTYGMPVSGYGMPLPGASAVSYPYIMQQPGQIALNNGFSVNAGSATTAGMGSIEQELQALVESGAVSQAAVAPYQASGHDLSGLSGQWADEDRIAMGALSTGFYKHYLDTQRYKNQYQNMKRSDWIIGDTAKKNGLNAFRGEVDIVNGRVSVRSGTERVLGDTKKATLPDGSRQLQHLRASETVRVGSEAPLIDERSFRAGDRFELRSRSTAGGKWWNLRPELFSGDVDSFTKGGRRGSNWAYDNDNVHTGEYGIAGTVTQALEKHGRQAARWKNALHETFPAQSAGLSPKNEPPAQKQARLSENVAKRKPLKELKKNYQASYREFSNIRSWQAGAEVRHLQNNVHHMENALKTVAQGKSRQVMEAELQKAKRHLDAQQRHFIELHHKNTYLQNTEAEIQKPLDELSKKLGGTRANSWDRLIHWGKSDADIIALKRLDQATNFAHQQGLHVQKVVEITQGPDNALQARMHRLVNEQKTQARALTEASRNNALTSAHLETLDGIVDQSIAATSKQSLGLNARLAKVMVPVAVALEGLNFANNVKNGDHRKAFTDLSTSLISGAASAAMVGAFITPVGWGMLAYAGATMGLGMVLNSTLNPLIDKGIKGANQWMNKTMGAPLVENQEDRKLREYNAMQQHILQVKQRV
jgi:hypothetical protein